MPAGLLLAHMWQPGIAKPAARAARAHGLERLHLLHQAQKHLQHTDGRRPDLARGRKKSSDLGVGRIIQVGKKQLGTRHLRLHSWSASMRVCIIDCSMAAATHQLAAGSSVVVHAAQQGRRGSGRSARICGQAAVFSSSSPAV